MKYVLAVSKFCASQHAAEDNNALPAHYIYKYLCACPLINWKSRLPTDLLEQPHSLAKIEHLNVALLLAKLKP